MRMHVCTSKSCLQKFLGESFSCNRAAKAQSCNRAATKQQSCNRAATELRKHCCSSVAALFGASPACRTCSERQLQHRCNKACNSCNRATTEQVLLHACTPTELQRATTEQVLLHACTPTELQQSCNSLHAYTPELQQRRQKLQQSCNRALQNLLGASYTLVA